MYNCTCNTCQTTNKTSTLTIDKTSFEDLLNSVFNAFKVLYSTGSYKVQDLFKTKEYKEVVKQTATILKQPILDNVIKKGMKNALEQDVFIFSALKTHAQLFEASRLLLDDEGKVKPFGRFQEDYKKLVTDYNETYLETEYNFAVSSSIMAGKWAELDENAILQYRTTRDDKVRDEHRALDRTTLPKTDPFWLEYYPPNGWNCRCTTIEVRKGKYDESDSAKAIEVGKAATTKYGKDGFNNLELFRFNPGRQQVVFPTNHPYSKVQGAVELKQAIKSTYTDAVVVKQFPNGGLIKQSIRVDESDNDYARVRNASEYFAKQGNEVEILPKIHFKNNDYNKFYADLKGTAFEGKCPDLRVNGVYYEHEGFTSTDAKKALKNMLNRGQKQATRIIIDDCGVTDDYIRRTAVQRIKNGQTIDEIHILKDGKLRRVF